MTHQQEFVSLFSLFGQEWQTRKKLVAGFIFCSDFKSFLPLHVQFVDPDCSSDLKRPITKKVGCSAFTHLMWVVILGGKPPLYNDYKLYTTKIRSLWSNSSSFQPRSWFREQSPLPFVLPMDPNPMIFHHVLSFFNVLPISFPWFIIIFPMTRVRLTLRGDVLCSGLSQRSPWLPVKPRHGIKKTSGLWRRVYLKSGFSEFGSGIRLNFYQIITHRIHGAGIYANIYHQYTPVMLAYIPFIHGSVMGYWGENNCEHGESRSWAVFHGMTLRLNPAEVGAGKPLLIDDYDWLNWVVLSNNVGKTRIHYPPSHHKLVV